MTIGQARRAAMRVGDLAHDRQAETGSVGPAGHERLEQMIADMRGRSRTLIANREDELLAIDAARRRRWLSRRRRLESH